VDRLELVVHQRDLDQRRDRRLLVQEALEVVKGALHIVHCGRHKDRRLRTVVRRADPVLRSADLAWEAFSTANIRQQDLVDLAQQTPRDRKRVESHHAVLQRADVVGDLTDRAFWRVAGLRVEDAGQRRLGPFDAAARERLPGDVGLDQHMRVR